MTSAASLGVVKALTYAHAKEGGILIHQGLRHLLFGCNGLVEYSGRQGRKNVGLHRGMRRCACGHGLRRGGNHLSAHASHGLRHRDVHALVNVEDDGGFAGAIAALARRHAQDTRPRD